MKVNLDAARPSYQQQQQQQQQQHDAYLSPADEVTLPPHIAASMLPPHLTVTCHVNLQSKGEDWFLATVGVI